MKSLTDQDFDKFRQTGDAPADEIIRQLIANEGKDFLRTLMPYLTDYQQLSYENQPKILQDFFKENDKIPSQKKFGTKPKNDLKNIYRATNFYRKHQESIGIVLACYSLPYCYLAADGAMVLYLTERIRNDTYRRLLETGKFINAVMNEDNWTNRKVFIIIAKVRLMHAAVRWFSLNNTNWNNAWGTPINQEDMCGTNAAFSFIVLRGLLKMGYKIDEVEEKAYLQTWNIIGNLMGVQAELLPDTWKEALFLEKMIAKRQFRASEAGKVLTKSLLDCYEKMAGNELLGKVFKTQTRYLLGDEYAEMLGVPLSEINSNFLKIYNSTNAFLSAIF